MQKLINVLALSCFLVSAAAVGAGVYIYTNKDALIEKAKSQVMESIKDTLPGALTGGLSGALVPDSLPIPLEPSQAIPEVTQYTSIPSIPF